MGGSLSTSWFETLRRDGVLFATVASLLVVFSSVLPVLAAPADAAGQSICSFYGDEAEPMSGDPCLACRLPGGCTAPAVGHATDGAALGVLRPVETDHFRPAELHLPAAASMLGAGSIRAPPPSA